MNTMTNLFHTGPSSAIVTITPEVAASILEKNMFGNRKVSERRVSDYAQAMIAGEFVFNGETIKICENGELIDGQHRLLACVKAKTPFKALVISGLPASVYLTIDKGKMKTAADALTQAGVANAKVTAGALRFYFSTLVREVPIKGRGYDLTSKQAVDFVTANPAFADSASFVSGRKHILAFCPPSIAISIHYHLSTKDDGKATKFFSLLDSGEGLDGDSPILVLRNKLISESAGGRKQGRTPPLEVAAWFINSWNAWRRGRPVSVIKGTIKGSTGVVTLPDAI